MKRLKGKDKKRCQQIHFKRRCSERLGFIPSKQNIEKVVKDIQEGNAEFLHKQSNRVSIFKVTIEEIDSVVTYDKQRKTITTIMPCSWWKEFEEKQEEELREAQ